MEDSQGRHSLRVHVGIRLRDHEPSTHGKGAEHVDNIGIEADGGVEAEYIRWD